METVFALVCLSGFIVFVLLYAGFRREVRAGRIVIPESDRFKPPNIMPNGEPPVDTGYWREKYAREHERGQGLVEYALLLVAAFLVGLLIFGAVSAVLNPAMGKNAEGTPIYQGGYRNDLDHQNLAEEIRSLHEDVYLLQTQVAGLDAR